MQVPEALSVHIDPPDPNQLQLEQIVRIKGTMLRDYYRVWLKSCVGGRPSGLS